MTIRLLIKYWYVIVIALLLSWQGFTYFQHKWEKDAIEKQHKEEIAVLYDALENQIDIKLKAVKDNDSLSKKVKTEIVYLKAKDKTLQDQQELLKLKRNEIENYINTATEQLLDSILRSN